MTRMVAITGALVDPARLVSTPRAATTGVIAACHWVLEIFRAAGSAARRLGGVDPQDDLRAVNQTPLVYSSPPLAYTQRPGCGVPGAATVSPGRVSLLAYPQWGPPAPARRDVPSPRRRQWRRPSVLTMSALHGGPPR